MSEAIPLTSRAVNGEDWEGVPDAPRGAGDCYMLGVKPEMIDTLPVEVWQQLERSLDFAGGTCQLEDLIPLYKSCDAQLWLVVDGTTNGLLGVVSTEIGIYPRAKSLIVGFCAGVDVERWLHWLGPLETWAASKGCTLSEPHGRRGWSRLLRRYGYEEAYTVFRKRIGGDA
jgi:hypothetical protein